ncbi:MAG: hypothetical protein U9O18_05065 [Chloroflexota bacterium]|nr:hypothetical protein [Chloroflexota bacterium]
MAVLQGARLRTGALPATAVAVRPRVAAPSTIRANRRARPMGRIMAGIVIATMLGLVYLTQTLGSNATSSEIRSLDRQRVKLTGELHRQAIQVEVLTLADVITKKAGKQGLRKLRAPVVLPAP